MVEMRAGNENLGLFLALLIFRPLISADGSTQRSSVGGLIR